MTVFKLREKVKELQADVAALRVKCQGDDSEEARNEKMERLMSKLSGKATKRCLMCWKQWHKKRVRSFKRHVFSLILSLRASNHNHAHIEYAYFVSIHNCCAGDSTQDSEEPARALPPAMAPYMFLQVADDS